MVTTLLAFWIYIYHCNVINAQCGYVEYGNLAHPLDTCSLSYEHTNSDIFEENWKSITFTCEETGTYDNVYANYAETSCSITKPWHIQSPGQSVFSNVSVQGYKDENMKQIFFIQD
eukprot:UN12925